MSEQPALTFARDDLLVSGISPAARSASFEAALANHVSGRRQTQCQRLLAAYRWAGNAGLTDGDLATLLDLKRHVVPARRRDLMKAGVILVATGERRGGSACWRVSE